MNGHFSAMLPRASTIASSLFAMNVSAIQAIPNRAIIATMPDLKIGVDGMSVAFTWAKISISAAAVSMIIWISGVTDIGSTPPPSAATVGLIVPPARRASAIAFVFIGWSVAAAATVPLTSWVGAIAGWRSAFWLVAAASAGAMAFVAVALPAGLRVAPVSLRTWLDVARDPVLPAVLAVTVTQMTGAFVLYTFIAPEVERRLFPSPTLVAALLACFGVAGVLGSAITSRIAERFPPGRMVSIGLGIATAGVLSVAIVPPWPVLYALAFFLWGLAGFAVQSLQQARLIAVRPAFAPATAALNSSAIYLGQALGGAIGALVIATGHPAWLAWISFALVAASVGVSIAADRRADRQGAVSA